MRVEEYNIDSVQIEDDNIDSVPIENYNIDSMPIGDEVNNDDNNIDYDIFYPRN